jgi:hypothetical protein
MRISNFNDTFYSDKIGIKRDDICVFGREDSLPTCATDDGISKLNNELIQLSNGYKVVLFSSLEQIRIDFIYEFIEHCISNNIRIIFDTFTFGYEDILKQKYNSELISYRPIELNFIKCVELLMYTQNKPLVVNGGVRTKLLKFCSFNRNLGKDYIIWELHKRNLLSDERNIITYHNKVHGIHVKTKDNLMLGMSDWYSPSEVELAGDIDFEFLKDLTLIPELESFDVGSLQKEQRVRLIEMHNDSMFNIIMEASYSFVDDISNPIYNFSSLFTKTIFPMYFRNVIYTMPSQSKLTNKLKEMGFELFFETDDEFFNNMTSEYYNSDDTQRKLTHNHNLVVKIYSDTKRKYGEGGIEWLREVLTD